MKKLSENTSNLILIFLLSILIIICGIPWILLMAWISKYLIIVAFIVLILGYLIVRGANKYNRTDET